MHFCIEHVIWSDFVELPFINILSLELSFVDIFVVRVVFFQWLSCWSCPLLIVVIIYSIIVIELLQCDESDCEISRHVGSLLANSQTLPGTLVSRFIACTHDTNTVDFSLLTENTHNPPNNSCKSTETRAKADWYSSNIQSHWKAQVAAGKGYSNDGYLLNTATKERQNSLGVAHIPSTEHKVLSNVRQFIDGLKRFLLNEPDTQLMFAIQRERVKVRFSSVGDKIA